MRNIESLILEVFNEPNCQILTKQLVNKLLQEKLCKDTETRQVSYSYVSASINRLVNQHKLVKIDRGLYLLNDKLPNDIQAAIEHLNTAKSCIDTHDTDDAKTQIDRAIQILNPKVD